MRTPNSPDDGNGPPPPINWATHPKRLNFESRAYANNSDLVNFHLEAPELTEFQHSALTLANMSSTQHSSEGNDEVVQLDGCDASNDGDTSDEVEFIRMLSDLTVTPARQFNTQQHSTQSVSDRPSALATARRSPNMAPVTVASPTTRSFQQAPSVPAPTAHKSSVKTNAAPATFASPIAQSPHQVSSRMTARGDFPTTPSRPSGSSQQLSFIPAIAIDHIPNPPKAKYRYYVVTVGKCAGIFYDTWEHVRVLVEHVPNAKYATFSTYANARNEYSTAKATGAVAIIRNPHDDIIYGPEDIAVQ